MAEARKTAPTRPHPRSPDTPPGNVVVGAAAGVADRIGDTVSGLAQGSVTAVGDLVATVLRRKKPRTAPRGSSTARRRPGDAAAEATEAAIDATRRAKAAADRAGRHRPDDDHVGQDGRGARPGRPSGAPPAPPTHRQGGAKSTAQAARANVRSTSTAAPPPPGGLRPPERSSR